MAGTVGLGAQSVERGGKALHGRVADNVGRHGAQSHGAKLDDANTPDSKDAGNADAVLKEEGDDEGEEEEDDDEAHAELLEVTVDCFLAAKAWAERELGQGMQTLNKFLA